MNTRLAPSRSAASATASAAGRPKVTRSIPVKTISPARMGSAPLDDLLKADGTRVAIAQVFVERPDRGIVGTDEQLDLPYAALCQPVLCGVHDLPAQTAPLVRRVGGDIVHPAAMAVFADHRRSHDASVELAYQHRRVRTPPR